MNMVRVEPCLSKIIIKRVLNEEKITDKDYLTFGQLNLAINRINQSEFDSETFQQLWDQCSLNTKGQAKISEFIDNLLAAQVILCQKIKQIAIKKDEFQLKIKNISSRSMETSRKRLELINLEQERQLLLESLSIIRNPFMRVLSQSHHLPIKEEIHSLDSEIKQNYKNDKTGQIIVIIFYLNLALISITVLGSMCACQFLSITAYMFIASQFLFKIISLKLIKCNILLLVVVSGLDIIWLILYSGKFWFIFGNYEFPMMMSNYLKFTVTVYFICFCFKLIFDVFILMFIRNR